MNLIDMNLVSCFLCCSAAVNSISRSGQGGRIVNVAARHALEWRGGAGLVAYTASKAAVAALTVALSEEVAKEGILVNAVAPSIMDTPANRAAMSKADYKACLECKKWRQPFCFSRLQKTKSREEPLFPCMANRNDVAGKRSSK